MVLSGVLKARRFFILYFVDFCLKCSIVAMLKYFYNY